ncbi:MAG: transketolase C-terminal domain-containing protein [Patescibacteria group bacterium]
MKKILEGSRAIAETIRNIGVGVVSAYPITPQTHIVEDLAKLKADGEADYEYVRSESEFAALSILVGASAAGARTYTATSSQGLLLMTEVIFNVAGMRLPIVMTDANRAISAPINIWNDQQDAVTMRDAGWIMFYGEDMQETVDLHVLAYKVAEQALIPVMVNLDGFVLTHVVEPVEVPESKQIKKYLPNFKASERLDVKNPLTFGAFATPAHYMEIRQELHADLAVSKKLIAKEMVEFTKVFGRRLSLVDYYGDKNADTVVVTMGSVLGTVKEATDELKKSGKKIGVVKVSILRPFPTEELSKLIGKKKNILVIDKSVSLGEEGILAGEIRRNFYGRSQAKIVGAIMGLGGRDITKEMIKQTVKLAGKTKSQTIFVGK